MQGFGEFSGRYLRADLSRRELRDASFGEKKVRQYLGGTGMGSRILYDEVPPEVEWSDPRNRIILASGPLGGTAIGGSGTFSLVTKGALTGGCTAAQANGLFGAFLRFQGYTGIIVQGVASRWTYLHIDDDSVQLREASHLLGKDTYDTATAIKEELGKQRGQMSVVSIGPAGEHLVRFAGVFADWGHSASHNGPGAVMGSKRLKAIAVSRGKKRVPVKNEGNLRKIAEAFYENAKSFTGTVGGVHRSYRSGIGTLPIKNYLTNIWDVSEEEIESFSEEYIRKNFSPQPNPCWACRLKHCTLMTIPEGPHKGMLVEEPEYEQLAAWGPVIDLKDVSVAAMLSCITDRVGIDNNEAGWLFGWVMECFEKGLLSKDDLNGLDLRWGNAEAVRQLLYMIANRQGAGDLLAEGVMRASRKVGGEAARCAIYTLKGNTPRGHDHRTRWFEMFDTSVSNTGTLETGATILYLPPDEAARMQKAGYPDDVSTSVALTKGLMVFEDSLGVCRFNTRMNLQLESEAVREVTGWDFTPEEGKNVGLRAVNLMKVYNLRSGITKEKDYPSERYGSTPVDGPSKGIAIKLHWETMLKNYYRYMGWDAETGKPLPETLRKLGLEDLIAALK
jgi:aldehyde:ferredoxin oxidoreductase